MKTVVINGRFASRPITGVERVAHECVQSLAKIIQQKGHAIELAIAFPRDVSPKLANVLFPLADGFRHRFGHLNGHAWEQLELPLMARGCPLLNFCNTAPLAKKDQIAFIHDAQVFSDPGSYSLMFRMVYHFLLPRVGRRSRVLATGSHFSRQNLERFGVFPPGKAMMVPYGVDHIDRIHADNDILTRQGIEPDGFLLAIGSLAPHKNLKMLIDARASLGDESLPLVVAGGGNSRIFADAGLNESDGIRILGRVSDGELKALYQSARAFFFPSLTEGFGLPPLEAMRCGCAVVATNAGAVSETLGNAALLLDPTDQWAWRDAMKRVSHDLEMCRELRKAGLEKASHFSWANVADAILSQLS